MKRRTSTLPIQVFKYGLPFGPTAETAELVEDQIRKGRRYRNRLVAFERNRRAVYRQIVHRDPEVGRLDDAMEAISASIEAENERMRKASQKSRKRIEDVQGKKKVDELVRRRKKLGAERKKAIGQISAALQGQLTLLEQRAKRWALAERDHASRIEGLFWGTYLIIEAAAQQAHREKSDPNFKRARPYSDLVGSDGTIAVQIQKGLTVAALLAGKGTFVRIDPLPEDAWKIKSYGERRRRTRTKLYIRVGSDERKKPIWAEFEDMNMHRKLPHDGIIKWVRVKRHRVGTRFRWECHITVEAASLEAPTRLPSVTAAVDFGWRLDEDSLRIARAMTEDGYSEDALLPMEYVTRERYADNLRHNRDVNFDHIQKLLCDWLETHEPPPWLAKALDNLPKWKSKIRLGRVVYRWRDERFDGDDDIFELLDGWLRQERHLYQWESFQREGAIRARQDLYRRIAKRWAKKFPRIVIAKDLDLRETAKRPRAGALEDAAAARVYRREAATGEFREYLIAAVLREGGQVVRKNVPANTCHACGGICDWDAERQDHHTCEHCGEEWQCDDNMCIKLHAAIAKGSAA